MKAQFLNLAKGRKYQSSTHLGVSYFGEKVAKVTLEEKPAISEEEPEVAIPINRARKGSLRAVINEDGKIEMQLRTYQKRSNDRALAKTLLSTTHSQVTRNSQRIRAVIEIPVTYSKERLAEAFDDECYQISSFIANSYVPDADSDC